MSINYIMKEQLLKDGVIGDPMNRVDGRMKVTGRARYSAEFELPNLAHAVLVTSTIAKGRIKSLETKVAERAPGVLAVISHLNSPKVPGFAQHDHPAEPPTGGQPLRVFYNDKVYSNGQPIALVVADTFERALYASSLVKAQYEQEKHTTDFEANKEKAFIPSQAKNNKNSHLADYVRGEEDAYKTADIKIEAEYTQPTEVHNPMELQAIVAHWEAEDKLTVYDKTQAVKGTQNAFAKDWNIPVENVKVIATFVGGAFGNGLHTWPHETAAIIAAKKVNRPVKLMLTREQMFFMVGYRPHTWQKIGMSATADGKLTAITHESIGQTSSYEEFTESTLQQSKMMYACPNVTTRYRILALDVSTPIWMRGPGEATGAFALESAMDEMAYALNIDPIEFRMLNHTERDPEKNLPWSTKYLKECIQLGAERIGWEKRQLKPRSLKFGEWLVGYGMGVGTFGANFRMARARARMLADGSVIIQSATTDIGPGTGTAMVQIAADALGVPPDKITFQLGNSAFPHSPSQGGSSTVSSVGSAVHAVCIALKEKIQQLGGTAFSAVTPEDITIIGGMITVPNDASAKVAYVDLLKQNNLQEIDVTAEAKPDDERKNYSMYSFSVHFAEVHVHPVTGVVRVNKVVSCADAGTIVNEKTAGNQMIGGAVGGIGMALMEAAVIDDRFGRYVTKDLAEYHVPVHADIPKVDVIFVNKPDLHVNPIGTKGIGEIALIGMAPAIANAVFNATGKRIRELPITPDKLI
ncbi:xanthine dehydrogenase family protein molybdopterin-binding subunit [Pontibacter silvestris]|uniref:Xanthine dehydrogenase family protein molybdopterin-binding subunit n=1 Tax=Pontibacter silvestris TaxID=2305183 RepID=A0ABW4WXJ1_9BACT|nr:xanthine dehydrogenase family protein molybdopterin-binding subunit [Pontibacter silvestris]MCC9135409.1 xanthine dehydrogenase family protein molybdopterin-binding subunit [Pontibacter silvestris]